jgi:hypothetical protein
VSTAELSFYPDEEAVVLGRADVPEETSSPRTAPGSFRPRTVELGVQA